MKITNISGRKLYLKDLKFLPQAQTEGRRGEDQYLAAGASAYLPDTSEVVRSAHKGDIFKLKGAGIISIQDTVELDPSESIVLTHNLRYPPTTTVLKQVSATWVDATGTVDIVHNSAFTQTTISNPTGFTLTFLIKLS